MKKFPVYIAIFFIVTLYLGCSDNTVTQNVTKKSLTYNVRKVPDTLLIQFEAVDTNFTIDEIADNLQFNSNPKIFYEIKADTGYGNFALWNNLDTLLFYKMFGGYVSDTASLPDIPWKYRLQIYDLIGKGTIKVTPK